MHFKKFPRRLGAIAPVVAIGAVVALVLGGCAPSAPTESDTPVTLEFYNFTGSADHADELQAIIDAFEKENPNITINAVNGAFADYFTSLQTRIAGNSAPDVFELNYENFGSFAASGALLDLAKADAIKGSDYFAKAYDAFNFDGKQYGVPESFSDVLLFYNKKMFDAAGVSYPTADWTWADEKAAAQKITDASTGTWGQYQPYTFNEFYKALAQSGGDFFNADKTAVAFDGPEGIAAAHWLVDKVGKTMPSVAQMGGQGDDVLFKQGKLAMWVNGIWQFGVLGDLGSDWDVVVEPGNTQKASAFFSNAGVISANTAHPKEAAKWLNFLTTSKTMVDQRLNNAWELPAVSDLSLFADYLSQTPPSNRQAAFDALDAVVTPPQIERSQEMQDDVTLALQKAVEGDLSVEEALKEAADQVNALLK